MIQVVHIVSFNTSRVILSYHMYCCIFCVSILFLQQPMLAQSLPGHVFLVPSGIVLLYVFVMIFFSASVPVLFQDLHLVSLRLIPWTLL